MRVCVLVSRCRFVRRQSLVYEFEIVFGVCMFCSSEWLDVNCISTHFTPLIAHVHIHIHTRTHALTHILTKKNSASVVIAYGWTISRLDTLRSAYNATKRKQNQPPQANAANQHTHTHNKKNKYNIDNNNNKKTPSPLFAYIRHKHSHTQIL